MVESLVAISSRTKDMVCGGSESSDGLVNQVRVGAFYCVAQCLVSLMVGSVVPTLGTGMGTTAIVVCVRSRLRYM